MVKIKPKKQKAKHRFMVSGIWRMILSQKMSNPRVIKPRNIFLHAKLQAQSSKIWTVQPTDRNNPYNATVQSSQNQANWRIYGNQVHL